MDMFLLLLFLAALSVQKIGCGHADMDRFLGCRSIPLAARTEPL